MSSKKIENADKPQELYYQDGNESTFNAGAAIGIVVTLGALAYYLVYEQLDYA